MRDLNVEVDGCNIRYLEAGDSGQAVILVHGLGGYARKWIRAVPALAERYRVIIPDMPGYGLSDKPVVDYTPDFFVNFLDGFISNLNLERPHLVGASLGGQVCAQFAAANQGMVSKLVLVSPAGMMKHSTPALDAYIMAALYPRRDSVANALMLMEGSGEEPDAELVSGFVSNMRRPNAKMVFTSSLLCFKNYPSIVPHLRSIASPTLLVWGNDDPIIPISYAAKFTKIIPRCTFVGMEYCGHTPYVQHPRRFAGIVLQFLDGQSKH